MYFYNVTVNLENDIVEDWLDWMKNKHIPDVLSTGYFVSYKMAKLIEPESEPNTTTFMIQYELKSLDDLKVYRETVMPQLQKEHNERYADKFVAFRSVIQWIE